MTTRIFTTLAALLLLVFCMLPLQGCYDEGGYYGRGYGYGYGYPSYSYSEPWYGHRYYENSWYAPRYVYHPWREHEYHWWHHDNDEWREHHWGHRWHDRDDWARGDRWRYRG